MFYIHIDFPYKKIFNLFRDKPFHPLFVKNNCLHMCFGHNKQLCLSLHCVAFDGQAQHSCDFNAWPRRRGALVGLRCQVSGQSLDG